MSSADFRHIAARTERAKSERLFRAAVSAFCSLTRPTGRDAAQLDDLALPLIENVSPETKRFCAAALSECSRQPAGLVRRLCAEPVEISAALLTRSPALTDIDLVTLIGRHGLPHARAIARRRPLNPTLVNLVRALEATVIEMPKPKVAPQVETPAAPAPSPRKPETAEETRTLLRGMMQPFEAPQRPFPMPRHGEEGTRVEIARTSTAGAYQKLRATAFTGASGLFETALADLLHVDLSRAHAVVRANYYYDLLTALRALDLVTAEAFVIVAAVFPGRFAHPEAIKVFHERYDTLHPQKARDIVRDWRMDTASDRIRAAVNEQPSKQAANSDAVAPVRRQLSA